MTHPHLNSELFAIIEQDGRSFINLSQVALLSADGPCTWVIMENGKKILTTKNLGYYQKILPPPDSSIINKFFRVHHKYLINLSFIKKYNQKDKIIYLHSDDQIPVSQRKVKLFTTMLRSYALY